MQIHRASQAARSRQACSPLSRELRKKYGRRSVRVIEGDSVDVSRGEYRNVQAKVASVDVRSGTVTLEGVQGEKQRGDRFDVKIHASNLRVTAINGRDKKRMKRLTGTESALPGPGVQDAPAPAPDAKVQAPEPDNTKGQDAPAPENAKGPDAQAEQDAPAPDAKGPDGGPAGRGAGDRDAPGREDEK